MLGGLSPATTAFLGESWSCAASEWLWGAGAYAFARYPRKSEINVILISALFRTARSSPS